MQFRKNTDRIVGICPNTGFRDMIPFTIHTLFKGASGTVPHNSQEFKMIALRLYHIAVVDMSHRLRGCNAANISQVVSQRFQRNPTRQMVRKPIQCIPLLCILLKPLADLRQQTTFGCHNSISHISGELRFGRRKAS